MTETYYISMSELWANLMYIGSPFREVHNHKGESLRQILERIPKAKAVPMEEYSKLYTKCEKALVDLADEQRKNRMLVQEIEELRREGSA